MTLFRLRKNGNLIIKLNYQREADNPLHLNEDFNGEELLSELGLLKGRYDWLWTEK